MTVPPQAGCARTCCMSCLMSHFGCLGVGRTDKITSSTVCTVSIVDVLYSTLLDAVLLLPDLNPLCLSPSPSGRLSCACAAGGFISQSWVSVSVSVLQGSPSAVVARRELRGREKRRRGRAGVTGLGASGSQSWLSKKKKENDEGEGGSPAWPWPSHPRKRARGARRERDQLRASHGSAFPSRPPPPPGAPPWPAGLLQRPAIAMQCTRVMLSCCHCTVLYCTVLYCTVCAYSTHSACCACVQHLSRQGTRERMLRWTLHRDCLVTPLGTAIWKVGLNGLLVGCDIANTSSCSALHMCVCAGAQGLDLLESCVCVFTFKHAENTKAEPNKVWIRIRDRSVYCAHTGYTVQRPNTTQHDPIQVVCVHVQL